MAWTSKSLARLRRALGISLDPRATALGEAEIAEIALRQAMAERRASIRKRAGARGGKRAERTAAQRFARDRARRLKKRFLMKRTWAIPPNLLFSKRIPSPILDGLDPSRPAGWKPMTSRKFKREMPRVRLSNLNFLDDPIGTMKQLQTLSRAEQEELNALIDFEDTHCLDVGAYLVIAEFWPQMSKVFHGGKMSLPVQKVLSAIRLDHELPIGLTGVEDHKDVWAFPIRHRRPRGKTASGTANLQPQEREKVADQLCDLINDWLAIASEDGDEDDLCWELTLEGRSLIARMTGELLDNAERHSMAGSSDGDWSTTAFMAARTNVQGERELRCYLAFLSTGQSVAETMRNAPAELLDTAEQYLGRFHHDAASRDTLLTVLALQDAITSDADARRNQRGGTGLQDVLELVGDLGAAAQPGADVRVTIVSGRSCVRLRHPNLLGRRDNNRRRVQWCNQTNDPREPPDPNIAFDLPAHLAGTLVSVGFTLDPKLFATDIDERDDSGD